MVYIQELDSLLADFNLSQDEREALTALSDSLVQFLEKSEENRSTLDDALKHLLEQGKLKTFLEFLFEHCPKTEEEREQMMNNFYQNID